MEQKIAIVKQYIYIRKGIYVDIGIRYLEGTNILDNDDLIKLEYAYGVAMDFLTKR